jgi:predicted aminopeptidase
VSIRSLRYVVRVLLVGSLALLSGCTSVGYYAQAAQGQFSLLYKAKPINTWLSDSSVNEGLKTKLRRVQEIREFAVRELGLPDNASYKNYADLKRPFVVWNVVATPEFSLVPEQWCFPVAGCVDYRGYYDKEAALNFAEDLRKKGLDVRVTGVPAYSTLGWFNDPVLSTFIQYPEPEVARLIFHELSHQVAYAAGDSPFNESFATAVEEVGLSHWLNAHGDDTMRESYRVYRGRRDDFLALLNKYRLQLEATYRRPISDNEKRQHKSELMQSMQTDYSVLKQAWGGYTGYDRWFNEPVSNAHFALIATYNDLVPEFKALLAEQKTLPAFYAAVKTLADRDSHTRHQMLQRYKSVVHQSAVKNESNNTAASQ